jgi:predicted dehydrogenase
VKYAVIGTGYWGSNHARVAAELLEEGMLSDVVLCDIDEDRVADLAGLYGIEYYTDYASLADAGVDAAIVATPSSTHEEVGTTLLKAGIDLLIEKPLALSSAEAWNIVDVAETNDCTLGVGHIFRYHPALNELKRRIERGELGRVKYLNTNRFSFRAPRSTTGVLYSLAVHDIDVYKFLLEKQPETIYCNMDDVIKEGIDETATLVLEYGDTTGVINESWQVPVFGKQRDLTVVGTERSAHIDYLDDNVLELHDATVRRDDEQLRAIDEGAQTVEVEDREPLRTEVKHFLDCCRNGETPTASGTVGAETIEYLERARQSSERNEVIRLVD